MYIVRKPNDNFRAKGRGGGGPNGPIGATRDGLSHGKISPKKEIQLDAHQEDAFEWSDVCSKVSPVPEVPQAPPRGLALLRITNSRLPNLRLMFAEREGKQMRVKCLNSSNFMAGCLCWCWEINPDLWEAVAAPRRPVRAGEHFPSADWPRRIGRNVDKQLSEKG